MTKVVPTTQEQLVHYLLHNIQLGTYDKRFLTNIHGQIFYDKKPLTTNQALLFEKIVMRYQRQLAKKELNSHNLIVLPWNVKPTPSLPQFTQAYVSIDDVEDIIVVHSPYKTSFVKEIKTFEIAKWNKEDKEWTINYCEENLKKIVSLVTKHYDRVVFCEVVENVLEEVNKYSDDLYWNPTLVNCNGNLLISGTNEYLNQYVTELNNDLPSIAKIISNGVDLGHGVISTDYKYYDFIKSRTITVDFSDIDLLLDFLKEIKCEKILVGELYLGPHGSVVDIIQRIKDSGISYVSLKHLPIDEQLENSNYVLLKNVLLNGNIPDGILKKATKIVGVTNTKLFK